MAVFDDVSYTVRIAPQQGSKEWEKGVVKNKHSERSYEVLKGNGRFIRRNRKYLRKTKEQFNPYNDVSYDLSTVVPGCNWLLVEVYFENLITL
jgi:hypothetical protein